MTEFIDRAGLPEATEFIRRKLTAFDLSKLDKLTLKASLRSNPLSWKVKKPVRVAKGSRHFESQFEITCSVIGEKYAAPDDAMITIPIILSQEFGQHPTFAVKVCSREALLVFAAGAACYQYLRRTRQVPGVARNSMARRYAFGWVAEFAPFDHFYSVARHSSDQFKGYHYTCFGVAIPYPFLVDGSEQDPTFFEYQVRPYIAPVVAKGDLNAIVAHQRTAVGKAVAATFGDCDQQLVDEVKQAANPESSWMILADWLEERGDPRSAWIRSHRLDIATGFMRDNLNAEKRFRRGRQLRLFD